MFKNNLNIFKKEYKLFCLAITELEKRNITKVHRIWDICNDDFKSSGVIRFTENGIDTSNYTPIKRTHGNSLYSLYDDNKLNIAIKKLISDLPNEYSYCYEKIFDKNNSFKYCTDVKTKIISYEKDRYWLDLITIKFANPQNITIEYDENIPSIYSISNDEFIKKTYSKTISDTSLRMFPIELFETRTPLYNAIKVFLWQGIMDFYKLDKSLHGVIIGNTKLSLF